MRPTARKFLYATLLFSCIVATTHAQTLLVNFQAADFTGGTTWKDETAGVTATATGTNPGGTVGNGTVKFNNGGFLFDTASVPGLQGLASYTIAVGFKKTGTISGTGANFYGGEGIIGQDIPGTGMGDPGIGLSTDGKGQVMAGSGFSDGNDYTEYDTQTGTDSGNFTTGSPTGVVLVCDGTSLILYVNGVATSQGSPLSPNGAKPSPFGLNGGANYQYGIGTISFNTAFVGEITQVKIYSGALPPDQAISLSQSIANPSVAAKAATPPPAPAPTPARSPSQPPAP